MLIALIGKKRTGKDTFADYIVENYNFITNSFALPIKKACQIIFDFTDEQINTDLKEEIDPRWGISPRQSFQIIGTDVFRNYLPNNFEEFKHFRDEFWIKRLQIWYQNNKDKNVIVSDVRFINENKAIKELGGILIKIENKNINYIDNHESEKLIDDLPYDHIIHNDNTLNEYYKKIDKLMNKITKKRLDD